jgi:hypothetical protein|tara:strand:- start:16667 stop:16777 length:111 start_codon:yes stop_codon:yes gene_type:complete
MFVYASFTDLEFVVVVVTKYSEAILYKYLELPKIKF